MRYLVTGGAGFIGSNLVQHLVAAGHGVSVLDDLSTGLARNLEGLTARFVQGSITDEQLVDELVGDVDVVIHLAARGSVPRSIKHPAATHTVNATGSLNVLLAAKKYGAYVVLASSSSVYGANAALPKREEMWMQPMSPYAASKLAMESYAMAFQTVYSMPIFVARFFNVYGPRQRPDHDYAAVVPKFIDAAISGRPLQIHGDGKQSRDFTYVDTVVELLTSASERQLTYDRPVNVAFGQPHTVLDVVELIEQRLGGSLQVEFVEPRHGDVPHSENDPALVNALFPDLTPVTLRDGLGRTMDWLTEGQSRTST